MRNAGALAKAPGMAEPDRRSDVSDRICSVPCCDRRAEKRGWCNTHYQRWRLTGDAGVDPAPKPGRSLSLRAGYVRVWEPEHPLAGADGYVYEHRKVVHDAGVVVPDGYHVHHVDGDKRNNDPANLLVASNSDHQAHHNQPGMMRKNQYGEWPIRAKG